MYHTEVYHTEEARTDSTEAVKSGGTISIRNLLEIYRQSFAIKSRSGERKEGPKIIPCLNAPLMTKKTISLFSASLSDLQFVWFQQFSLEKVSSKRPRRRRFDLRWCNSSFVSFSNKLRRKSSLYVLSGSSNPGWHIPEFVQHFRTSTGHL